MIVAEPEPTREPRERAEEHVTRHVRRTVGLRVLRELHRWADGVEREQRQRPRLVAALLVLIAVVSAAAALLAWSYYRGF